MSTWLPIESNSSAELLPVVMSWNDAWLDTRRLIREVKAEAYAVRIREDFKAGVRAGVNGTPSFFINGQRYDGAHELEPMLAAIVQSGSDRRKRPEKLPS